MTATGGAPSLALPIAAIVGTVVLITILRVHSERQAEGHETRRRRINRSALRARERFDDDVPGLLLSFEEERSQRAERGFRHAGYVAWPEFETRARASSQPAAGESNGGAQLHTAAAQPPEQTPDGRGKR